MELNVKKGSFFGQVLFSDFSLCVPGYLESILSGESSVEEGIVSSTEEKGNFAEDLLNDWHAQLLLSLKRDRENRLRVTVIAQTFI